MAKRMRTGNGFAPVAERLLGVTSPTGSRNGPPFYRRGGASRVLVAISDLGFHQEVLDFLVRNPRMEVAAAVSDVDSLARRGPVVHHNMTISCPDLARAAAASGGDRSHTPIVVIAQEMTVPVLRQAIQAGAEGVFAWPDEREDLVRTILQTAPSHQQHSSARGKVVAVYGTGGGVRGALVATHLTAAFARKGLKTVLVDLDVGFAEVSPALGIAPEGSAKTIVDLVPVMEELSPDHVEDALYRHTGGFSVLLAPQDGAGSMAVGAGAYAGCIALLAHEYEAVILHIPRALDPVSTTGIDLADEIVLLTDPDAFSLHATRRAIGALGLRARPARYTVVVNRSVRGGLPGPAISNVLGSSPDAFIRFDAAVRRSRWRGHELPPVNARAAKDLDLLANRLISSPALSRTGEEI